MSVTTTENPTVYTLRQTLRDYELHHSEPITARPNDHPAAADPEPTENPSDWPTDHRRVPSYRPTNMHRDLSQVFVYQNRGEQAFIQTMFFGIRVVTLFNRVWQATGGKVNDEIYRYDIGGEY